ncbi:macrocin O-methyltransferase [Alphaproteobacteria bacterium]|nr:macrocin O-methyltransferase [Alphaproteobacteria bacterium]
MKNKNLKKNVNDILSVKKGFAKPLKKKSIKSYDDFLAFSEFDRIQKILVKYELFKLALNVPGDIVECGVHTGSGIYLYSKLLKIFKPNTIQRVVGFDFFGHKSKKTSKYKFKMDKEAVTEHIDSMFFGSSMDEIYKNLADVDIYNVDLIPGDVRTSTKKYVKDNLGFRISFLVLDVDNYEGTFETLKNLYPYVSRGGLVVFDEYALRTYGESDAVDDYFKNKDIELKTFSWGSTPSAYIIKK